MPRTLNTPAQANVTINGTGKPASITQSVTLKSPQPSNTYSTSNGLKMHKAVKHTQSFLKEILPPPIMQSTKRSAVNKAIKHTGGGSNAYYQTLANANLNSNKNNQPLTQLNLNQVVDLSPSTALLNTSVDSNTNQNLVALGNSLGSGSFGSNNKITITTTYVYKRVQQPPDIDLFLECEEEELVYIKPPSPSPSPVKSKEIGEQTEFTHEPDQVEPKLKNNVKNETTNVNSEEKAVSCSASASKVTSGRKGRPKSSQPTHNNADNSLSSLSPTVNGIYFNVLAKYYSRRPSNFADALEKASLSRHTGKRAKGIALPADLRIGNYPAKVRILLELFNRLFNSCLLVITFIYVSLLWYLKKN
jgi:hypothetical protein